MSGEFLELTGKKLGQAAVTATAANWDPILISLVRRAMPNYSPDVRFLDPLAHARFRSRTAPVSSKVRPDHTTPWFRRGCLSYW